MPMEMFFFLLPNKIHLDLLSTIEMQIHISTMPNKIHVDFLKSCQCKYTNQVQMEENQDH